MHRFAQFFIRPLMSQDAVLREIKAVDSGKQLFYAWMLFILDCCILQRDTLIWSSKGNPQIN